MYIYILYIVFLYTVYKCTFYVLEIYLDGFYSFSVDTRHVHNTCRLKRNCETLELFDTNYMYDKVL